MYGLPSSVEWSEIADMTGAITGGVTVSSHVSSSDPALLVARMVTVWGLPTLVGLAQLTTPVVLLIVIPLGLAIRDQVTGKVP